MPGEGADVEDDESLEGGRHKLVVDGNGGIDGGLPGGCAAVGEVEGAVGFGEELGRGESDPIEGEIEQER